MSPSLIKSIHLFWVFLHLLQNNSEEVRRCCGRGEVFQGEAWSLSKAAAAFLIHFID